MPKETKKAIEWAMQQQYEIDPDLFIPVSINVPFTVVDKVREYFNDYYITYSTFGFDDLIPYL